MSRLDELIQELCPDGVSFVKMGECCTITKGQTPIQKAIPGEYPLVVTTDERKSSNTYQFDKPSVCIPLGSSRGHGVASLNQVYYQEGKFALGNILCAVTPKDSDELSAKFLHQYLNLKKDVLIVPLMRGGANVSLSMDSLEHIKIPIPPMPVQLEIVYILEKFTELITELTFELTARRKQYNYYRDKLLTFDRPIENKNIYWTTIADICKTVVSGGTPKSSNADYYGGTIPWLRTQEVDWRDINDTEMKITEQGLASSSAKWIPENCVIVAMYGATAAKVAINKIPLTTNQACCNLEVDENKALYRYVFHWLSKEYKSLKALGQGSQSNISVNVIKQYRIPVPSLDIQERIVNVLDNFDAICSDLNIGLPAEIEARKKQYEFYRDRLLTFDNASTTILNAMQCNAMQCNAMQCNAMQCRAD
ncbi:MAG: restriction endonuclease subunit S [Lachnospiraceae bacterium]|nr:restriction endonuclease subunit S [Lachnospiraceae bacterium]